MTAGLANMGNTCYLNTVLQCMFAIPPIREYFLSFYHLDNVPECQIQNMLAKLVYSLYTLQQPTRPQTFLNFISNNFSNKSLDFHQQNDAHEFYTFLIDKIVTKAHKTHLTSQGRHQYTKSLNHIAKLAQKSWESGNNNPLFHGQLVQQIHCSNCDYFLHSIESFLILNTNSLCLGKLFESQALPGYKCDKCKGVNTSDRVMRLWTIPKLLVININRFDITTHHASKRTDSVEPLESLDLGEYIINSNIDKAKYKLMAVAAHIGSSASGHYYAYVYNHPQWYQIDDINITSLGQGLKENNNVQRNSYLYFYCLV